MALAHWVLVFREMEFVWTVSFTTAALPQAPPGVPGYSPAASNPPSLRGQRGLFFFFFFNKDGIAVIFKKIFIWVHWGLASEI